MPARHHGISVRVAELDDLEAIAQLHAEVQRLHHAAQPQAYKPPSLPVIRELVVARFAEPAAQYLVATMLDGSVAGYLRAVAHQVPETPLTHAQAFVEVDEICVWPAQRRTGVARLLSERAAQWAGGRGMVELRLTVRAFNEAAHRTYLALGYTPLQHRLALSLVQACSSTKARSVASAYVGGQAQDGRSINDDCPATLVSPSSFCSRTGVHLLERSSASVSAGE